MSAERINQLLVLLPDSELPDDVVWWLVAGLEGWQRGQSLEDALGLHDDDSGHCSMDLYERDDLIRAAIRLCPGDSESAQASYFLEVMHGQPGTLMRLVRASWTCCACARVYVPKTLRHLRRILAGRRCDGWRYQEDTGRLCPEPVQRFNGGKFTNRTGT